MKQPIIPIELRRRPMRKRRPAPRFDPDSPQSSTSLSSRKRRKPNPIKEQGAKYVCVPDGDKSGSAKKRSHNSIKQEALIATSKLSEKNDVLLQDKSMKHDMSRLGNDTSYFCFGRQGLVQVGSRDIYKVRNSFLNAQKTRKRSLFFFLNKKHHQNYLHSKPLEDDTPSLNGSINSMQHTSSVAEFENCKLSQSEFGNVASPSSSEDQNHDDFNVPSLVYQEFNSSDDDEDSCGNFISHIKRIGSFDAD